MLPSDLLFSHKRGAQVYPRFLRREQQIWAEQVLNLIREHQHRSRGELRSRAARRWRTIRPITASCAASRIWP